LSPAARARRSVRFSRDGGVAGSIATLTIPVFDLAFDTEGRLWAATGGGPLLQLDPITGAVLASFGDGITQAVVVDPATGRVFVSTGNGIDFFDPATATFTHFSDQRVGSLAFAPDGQLWGATWPARGDVVRFDDQGHGETMLRFDTPVDSIAFGRENTQLAGLLFVSENAGPLGSTGSRLIMVDLVTRQQVAVAQGGSRGDIVETTADGRVLLSLSNQVVVLNPEIAPRVLTTVALPRGSFSGTFDQDMFAGSASDPESVLNPANYHVTGVNAAAITIRAVVYDAHTRTAILTTDALEPDRYEIVIDAAITSVQGLALDAARSGGQGRDQRPER
jgi:hypothetical protein